MSRGENERNNVLVIQAHQSKEAESPVMNGGGQARGTRMKVQEFPNHRAFYGRMGN